MCIYACVCECVCVCVSHFFPHEQFPLHVGVREVNTSGEGVELGADVLLIWHLICS